MRQILAFLLVALLASPAFAAVPQAREIVTSELTTGITSVDLSTSPTTSTLSVQGFSLVKMTILLVRNLATDIVMTCEESDVSAFTNPSEVTTTDSNGLVTKLTLSRLSIGANVTYTMRPDVTGFLFFRCTFTGTASTSTDFLTVTARGVRGL